MSPHPSAAHQQNQTTPSQSHSSAKSTQAAPETHAKVPSSSNRASPLRAGRLYHDIWCQIQSCSKNNGRDGSFNLRDSSSDFHQKIQTNKTPVLLVIARQRLVAHLKCAIRIDDYLVCNAGHPQKMVIWKWTLRLASPSQRNERWPPQMISPTWPLADKIFAKRWIKLKNCRTARFRQFYHPQSQNTNSPNGSRYITKPIKWRIEQQWRLFLQWLVHHNRNEWNFFDLKRMACITIAANWAARKRGKR